MKSTLKRIKGIKGVRALKIRLNKNLFRYLRALTPLIPWWMLRKRSFSSVGNLMLRAFVLAVVIAMLAIVTEIIYAWAVEHPFTSLYSSTTFCGLIGMFPFLESPSRLSFSNIGIMNRMLLVLETACFALLSVLGSYKFMEHRHITSVISPMVGIYSYLMVLIVTFFIGIPALKREYIESKKRTR